MAKPLNSNQIKAIEEWIRRNPSGSEKLFTELEAQGFTVEREEFQPVSLGTEAGEFGKGILEGASLGLVEFDENPEAGDIELPLVGDVHPSRGLGMLGGYAVPGMPAYKAASAATKGIASAAGRATARETMVGGGLGAGEAAIDVAKGESTPLEALQNIALWAAGGALIGSVEVPVANLVKRAFGKAEKGIELTAEEIDAVDEVAQLAGLDVPRLPPHIDKRRMLRAPEESGEVIEVEPEVIPLLGERRRDQFGRMLPESTEGEGIIINELEQVYQLPPRRQDQIRRQLPPSTASTNMPIEADDPNFGGVLPEVTQSLRDRNRSQIYGPNGEIMLPGQYATVLQELDQQVSAGTINSGQAMNIAANAFGKDLYLRDLVVIHSSLKDRFLAIEQGSRMPPPPLSIDRVSRQSMDQVEMDGAKPRRSADSGSAQPEDLSPADAGFSAGDEAVSAGHTITIGAAIRRVGGLDPREVNRLKDAIGVIEGPMVRQMRDLGNKDGSGVTIETAIEEIKANPELAAAFQGIDDWKDLANAIHGGNVAKKVAIDENRAIEAEYSVRTPDFDPSYEGFEGRIAGIRDFNELDLEIDRIGQAVDAERITPKEAEELTRRVSEQAQEITGTIEGGDAFPFGANADAPAAPAGATAPDPFEPRGFTGRPPSAAAAAPEVRPLEDGTNLFPGESREIPRGPKSTRETDRGEGTPLFDQEADVAAAAERAAASQGKLGDTDPIREKARAAVSEADEAAPHGITITPKKLVGKNVLVTTHDGKKLVGVLMDADPDVPRSLNLRIRGLNKNRYVDYKDVQSVDQVVGVAGGGPTPPPVPWSDGQRKKIWAMRDDLKALGIDVEAPRQGGLTKAQASALIDQWELQRSIKVAELQDDALKQLDTVAADKGDFELSPPPPGKPKDPPDHTVEASDPDYYKDSSFLYSWFLANEGNRQGGLSANAFGRAVYQRGLTMIEAIQRDSEKFLVRAEAAIKGVSREDKFRLTQALDRDVKYIDKFPHLAEPYKQLRQIFDELADMLGLDKDQKISTYFPHLFRGTMGRWRAIQTGQELGARTAKLWARKAGATAKISGMADVQAGVPLQTFFLHVLKREGVDGFELDLDKALYTYITGAVRKVEQDQYLDFALKHLRGMPKHDQGGRELAVRAYLADHIRHVVGRPGRSRELIAKFWKDNRVFNAGVDRLVEIIGGAPEQGLLKKARRLGELNDKKVRGTLAPGEGQELVDIDAADVTNWLNELIDSSQKYVDGLKADTPRMKRYRAEMALALDDLRANMGNEHMKSFVFEQAYRAMVVAKLGLNMSHGLINLTQWLVNTNAVLDVRYAARGARNYLLADKDYVIANGKTVRQILVDSGVLQDVPRAEEFFKQRFGFMAKVQNAAMAPARMSESFNRGSTLLGAYEQYAAEGMSHTGALKKAIDVVQKTQFPFNRVGTPRILRSPGLRLLLMFQSYPIHQANFSAELIANATKGDIAPLIKHSLAYISLFGAGLAVGQNFWLRTQHPMMDVLEINGVDEAYERDTMDLLSGPPGAALLHALDGNVQDALSELEPSISRRVRKVADGADPSELLFGTTFQDPKEKRPRRKGVGAVQPVR